MSGVLLREFSNNAEDIYLEIYDETNLADLIVETDAWMYPESSFLNACSEINNNSKALIFNCLSLSSRIWNIISL